ncbi:MAG: alpha/beta hydrolase [Verrucomicrobiota bacterium]|jgi:acetyl esterase/lipase
MKTAVVLTALLCSVLNSRSEVQAPVPLWPNGAPGALGTSSNDIPTLAAYLPDATDATGAAIVICPGGGYVWLAPHEGNDFALWLNQHGVTCFVLKYRLGLNGYRHPAMLNDAARAVRWVRAQAQDFKVDPHRVGIMGSSAGGHLASTLLTHFDAGDASAADPIDRQSSRPDVGVLCYPVISMGKFTHQGSRDNLIGTNAPADLVASLSNELRVTTNTPPCFIWTVFDDKVVPLENSMLFAGALQKNRVPFELHIYDAGWHGMGLNDKPPFEHPHPWAAACLFWLHEHKFAN